MWSQAASQTAQKLKVYNSLNIIELTYEKSVNHNHVRPLYDLDKETKQPELPLARRLNVNAKFHKGKVLISTTSEVATADECLKVSKTEKVSVAYLVQVKAVHCSPKIQRGQNMKLLWLIQYWHDHREKVNVVSLL